MENIYVPHTKIVEQEDYTISKVIIDIVNRLRMNIVKIEDGIKKEYSSKISLKSLEYNDDEIHAIIEFNAISLSSKHDWKNTDFKDVLEGAGWVDIKILESDYPSNLNLAMGFDSDDVLSFNISNNSIDDLFYILYANIDDYNETIEKIRNADIKIEPVKAWADVI